jgi:hypothetical protein
MTDSDEKMIFLYEAFWKVYFTTKVGVLFALNTKPYILSKFVDWVISYVPWKCSTVNVVNCAKIGRSMTNRKFRVQSSLFEVYAIASYRSSRKRKILSIVSLGEAWF